jgi:hypothetical protein
MLQAVCVPIMVLAAAVWKLQRQHNSLTNSSYLLTCLFHNGVNSSSYIASNVWRWDDGNVFGWGTMLQARRQRVQFPMRSLDFQLT